MSGEGLYLPFLAICKYNTFDDFFVLRTEVQNTFILRKYNLFILSIHLGKFLIYNFNILLNQNVRS